MKYPISRFFRVINCIWGYYAFMLKIHIIFTVHFCKTNFSIFQKHTVLYHVALRPPSLVAQSAVIGHGRLCINIELTTALNLQYQNASWDSTLCTRVGKFTPRGCKHSSVGGRNALQ